ncbi:hypothetical protein FRB90_003288 [Tulasnella sp. 427]|nr:hypothetical protein FRB90_003288 [Tulasnella sp. 427]
MSGFPPSYNNIDAPAYTAGPSDALPAYDDRGAPSAFIPASTINDKLPNHFKINGQYVQPQLLSSDLHAHLVLLGAFHRLREEVRTVKGNDTDIRMEPEERWAVFLQRAVHRFEQWAIRMIGGEGNEEEHNNRGPASLLAPTEVPPLDVMMVWHTYMLNPRAYYEDCIRNFQGLLNIGSFPLMQLAGSIDQESLLPHPPSTERASAFRSLTGQPFEYPVNTTSEHTLVISCPSCSQPSNVPWITHLGDGYAQRGFVYACEKCNFKFNREALGVRTFYDDMEKCFSHPDKYFLANSIVDHQVGLPVDPQVSQALSEIVIGARQDLKGARAEQMGGKLGWTMNDVEDYCRIGVLDKHNKPFLSTPRQYVIALYPESSTSESS